MSRSGLMGVVEEVRSEDLHPSIIRGFSGVVRLLVRL